MQAVTISNAEAIVGVNIKVSHRILFTDKEEFLAIREFCFNNFGETFQGDREFQDYQSNSVWGWFFSETPIRHNRKILSIRRNMRIFLTTKYQMEAVENYAKTLTYRVYWP